LQHIINLGLPAELIELYRDGFRLAGADV